MSDHNRIDDVFSIADGDGGPEDTNIDQIYPRNIPIHAEAVPVTIKAANNNNHLPHLNSTNPDTKNGSHAEDTFPQTAKNHSAWGIGSAFENPAGENLQANQDFEGERTETNPIHPDHDQQVPHTRKAPSLANDQRQNHANQQHQPTQQSRFHSPIGQQDTSSETIERVAYLRLVAEKAKIEFCSLQNPDYHQTNISLLHRLDTALYLLQEIVSSGHTLQEAQAQNEQLNQEVLTRIHSQIAAQRSTAEERQEPLDNETRAKANLPLFTLSIGEDLRLRLLKASILTDIQELI